MLSVEIKYHTFESASHQRQLEKATNQDEEILEEAMALFRELWDQKTPLRLLGLSLTSLSHGEQEQFSLFRDERREREKKMDKTVDLLRGRFGADIIRRGSVLDSSAGVGRKYKAHLENEREGQ